VQIEKIFPGDGSGPVLVGFGMKIPERNSAIFALQDILFPDDAPLQIELDRAPGMTFQKLVEIIKQLIGCKVVNPAIEIVTDTPVCP